MVCLAQLVRAGDCLAGEPRKLCALDMDEWLVASRLGLFDQGMRPRERRLDR